MMKRTRHTSPPETADRIAEMRNVIKPFADAVHQYPETYPDSFEIAPENNLTLGDLRRAHEWMVTSKM